MDFSNFGGVGLQLLEFLLPLIAVVLTVGVAALLKKGVDSIGVNRSAQIDTMIDKYVEIGVNAAKMAAEKKLNTSSKMSGDDKLGLATKTVLTELEQSGLKSVGEQLIKDRIENFLHIDKSSGTTLKI